MKQMPLIQKYMTPMPHTIQANAEIADAQSLMREHRIRHIPVLDKENLIGVVTDRDVKLATGFADTVDLKVNDILTPEPYTVDPETPVNRVVSEMAERKYGCAIVQQKNGKIVGIFTAVDGLRVLADTLDVFYKPAAETTGHRPSPRI